MQTPQSGIPQRVFSLSMLRMTFKMQPAALVGSAEEQDSSGIQIIALQTPCSSRFVQDTQSSLTGFDPSRSLPGTAPCLQSRRHTTCSSSCVLQALVRPKVLCTATHLLPTQEAEVIPTHPARHVVVVPLLRIPLTTSRTPFELKPTPLLLHPTPTPSRQQPPRLLVQRLGPILLGLHPCNLLRLV